MQTQSQIQAAPALNAQQLQPASPGGLLSRHFLDYRVPASLNTFWSFGLLVAFSLAVLTVSGIWLSMYYVPAPGQAFNSIQFILRSVNFGWLIRDLHLDGTTMLFGAVYVELFRGLYYGTYRNGRASVWVLEVLRFFLLLTAGFLGFVMVFGASAYASLMIMASHLGALGNVLLAGYSINAATMPRIETLHLLAAILAIGVAGLGFIASRAAGEANPDGIPVIAEADKIPLHPYFTMRALFALVVFMFIFAVIFTFAPNLSGTREAFGGTPMLALPMDPVPPWYLLGFHGFARAAGTPGFGTALTILAFLLLAALPWLDRGTVASCRYRPSYRGFVWALALDWVLLSFAASLPATHIATILCEACAIYFFLHFLVITPLVTGFGRTRPVPDRPRYAGRPLVRTEQI
jgi:quinol-cytochrome oxidoreductase complex cytochrome b subunit